MDYSPVLIFSKYSPSCNQLFSRIQQCGVDFSFMQLFCIDNNAVRQRISSANKIDLNTVPCVLCIFSDGRVEKYEGENVFTWVNGMIEKMLPPPPPRPVPVQFSQPQEEVPEDREDREDYTTDEQEDDSQYYPPMAKSAKPSKKQTGPQTRPVGRPPNRPTGRPVGRPATKGSKNRPKKKVDFVDSTEEFDDQPDLGVTPIDTLVSQEQEYDGSDHMPAIDPHNRDLPQRQIRQNPRPTQDPDEFHPSSRTMPPPRRMRQDEGNYIEDDSLYSGDPVDNRREKKKNLRNSTTHEDSQDPHGTMALAKDLAQGRDEIDRMFNPPKNRPQQPTRFE